MDTRSCPINVLPTRQQRSKSPQYKRWGVLALLLFLSSGMGWWVVGLRQPQGTPTVATTSPVTVKTAIATQQPITIDRTLTGTVESAETVTLTSRVMGQIRQLTVREGDRVTAGQQVAEIDVRDIQAQQQQASAAIPQAQSAVSIAQSAYLAAQAQSNQAQARVQAAQAQRVEAQAELADAQRHQRRMAVLQQAGAVSQSRLDEANTRVAVIEARIRQIQAGIAQAQTMIEQAQASTQQAQAQVRQAQAQVKQAQAGVEQAQANLDYGTVLVPFAGVITHKYTEVGAIAGPGQPIVKLERSDHLRLSVDVPESLIGQVKQGQPIAVQIDALNRNVTGFISQIIPAAAAQSHTFTVKVDLPATPAVMPGMFGRLRLRVQGIANGDRQELTIPKAALVKQFGVTGVFTVVDHQAQFQPITTGQSHGPMVEVFSGIEGGDRIIVDPSPTLQNGTLIRFS